MRYEDSCVNEAFNEYADAHSSDEPLILQELFRETYLKMLNPRMISENSKVIFCVLFVV